MKVTDWAVRTLVVATFFAYFVAPSRWMFPLQLLCFGAVGLWALLYPEGVLGWVKTAHPSLDVNDGSIWWVPRLDRGILPFLRSSAGTRISCPLAINRFTS